MTKVNLITDRTGSLYHLKQVKGRPYFRKIEIPNGLKIKYIFPTEFKNRKYHAFLTDDKNDLYVLYTKTYELKKAVFLTSTRRKMKFLFSETFSTGRYLYLILKKTKYMH